MSRGQKAVGRMTLAAISALLSAAITVCIRVRWALCAICASAGRRTCPPANLSERRRVPLEQSAFTDVPVASVGLIPMIPSSANELPGANVPGDDIDAPGARRRSAGKSLMVRLCAQRRAQWRSSQRRPRWRERWALVPRRWKPVLFLRKPGPTATISGKVLSVEQAG
jgi:hypothetical protein